MPTYSELLKDPRWQRKRLEIMQRDRFLCAECFQGEKTLNVHHKYYKSGHAPWEYPDDALVTLCEDCHKNVSESTKTIKECMAKFSPNQLEQLSGYAHGISMSKKLFESDGYTPRSIDESLRVELNAPITCGFMDALEVRADMVSDLIDPDGKVSIAALLRAACAVAEERGKRREAECKAIFDALKGAT